MKFRIEGPRSEIEALKTELEKIQPECSGIKKQAADPLAPAKQGMEPMTYFLVAFSAHLAAATVHDLGHWLLDLCRKRGLTVTPEQAESSGDD